MYHVLVDMGFATRHCVFMKCVSNTRLQTYAFYAMMPGGFCNLPQLLLFVIILFCMVVGHSLTSFMRNLYVKNCIFIRCFNITEDDAHYFTFYFCLLVGSKVGAWITFLCRSLSRKRCTIHIFFRTSLLVITAPLVSY